jgi:carboxyl-terminal processing protease
VLLAVDGTAVDGLDLAEVVDLLRGPPGSRASIRIRTREGQERDVVMAREVVELEPVSARLLAGRVGYLRILDLRGGVAEDVGEALTALQADGARALIVDLRNNPGGLLGEGPDVAALFVEDGLVIASVHGRTCAGRPECVQAPEGGSIDRFVTSNRARVRVPLVVIVNAATSGGAEVVAAALQQHAGARVVGVLTAGADEVATLSRLSDGTYVRYRSGTLHRGASGPTFGESPVRPDEVVQPRIGAAGLDDDPLVQRALGLLADEDAAPATESSRSRSGGAPAVRRPA